ncbi:DUF1906 domain-containing protein [Streptomyces sp. CAU 1734]|uniref:DUF1906 domain-containing protein n=1 Tax=Streptomyces sp. CAU 1734 TaxID=3140360 RepID=UPI003261C693
MAALVVTALFGLPELLLAPAADPDPARDRTGYAAGTAITPDTTADTAVTYQGLAFDICRVPPLAVMRAWRTSSPYGAVGIPYGGRGRDCPGQQHLTRAWVEKVHRMGWRVLPVFVGSQPPCARDEQPRAAAPEAPAGTDRTNGTDRTDRTAEPSASLPAGRAENPSGEREGNEEEKNKREVPMGRFPGAQGEREGSEAVARARALGMIRGSALYVSLKSYALSDPSCARTTLDFIRAWNREVRRLGYVPGLRSDADAGVLHMERARREGTGDLPSALWFARWNGRPSLLDEEAVHPYAWRVKRRIHQYEGEAREEYGGHALTVGRNLVDAPVARFRP